MAQALRIFISHAHKNRLLVNALVDCIVGLGIPRTRIRQTSTLDTGIPLGENWKTKLVTDIQKSTLFLAVVTPQFETSAVCQAEVGIAVASKVRIIPMTSTSSTVKGFLHDLEKVERTPESLAKLLETIASVIKVETAPGTVATMVGQFLDKTELLVQDLNSLSEIANDNVMSRGDLIDDVNIIDATFYLQKKGNDEPQLKTIETCLEQNLLIPAKFQYSIPTGAKRWIELCNDRTYYTNDESIRFLLSHLDELLAIIGEEVINKAPDYVSLGPGNGAKDIIILQGMLRQEMSQGNPEQAWFFYPYDVSMFLLCNSITNTTTNDLIRDRLKIKAICAEFDHLTDFRPVFDYRPAPNIFSFLGNTLGNMSQELEFLNIIQSTMNPEDIFILEVRLKDRMDTSNPGGSEETRKRFNFSPLESLGIPYDSDKLTYSIMEPALSQIPGTVSLRGLYTDFRYKDKDISRANLCCINHYDLDQLENALSDYGFQICWRKKSQDAKTGMLLLKKKTHV